MNLIIRSEPGASGRSQRRAFRPR